MRQMIIKGMLVVAGVFLISTSAHALDFSADVVNKAQGSGGMTGKIYVAGNKIRMEFAQAITITRGDKKTVWLLMPEQKTYMEQKFDPRSTVGTSEKVEGEMKRELIATEKVDGKPAKKYLVTYKAQGEEGSVYQWIRDGLMMPVKTEAIDGSWGMEFKNIKTGGQSKELFEVPAGYEKFSMGNVMGGALKGMMGFGK